MRFATEQLPVALCLKPVPAEAGAELNFDLIPDIERYTFTQLKKIKKLILKILINFKQNDKICKTMTNAIKQLSMFIFVTLILIFNQGCFGTNKKTIKEDLKWKNHGECLKAWRQKVKGKCLYRCKIGPSASGCNKAVQTCLEKELGHKICVGF